MSGIFKPAPRGFRKSRGPNQRVAANAPSPFQGLKPSLDAQFFKTANDGKVGICPSIAHAQAPFLNSRFPASFDAAAFGYRSDHRICCGSTPFQAKPRQRGRLASGFLPDPAIRPNQVEASGPRRGRSGRGFASSKGAVIVKSSGAGSGRASHSSKTAPNWS